MTARTASTLAFATLLALAGTSAFAQHNPKAPVEHAEAPASAPKASVDPVTGALVDEAPPVPSKDGQVQHLVSEDSQVRIEETACAAPPPRSWCTPRSRARATRSSRATTASRRSRTEAAGMRTFSWGF